MQPVPPLTIALRPSQHGRFALVVIHGLAVLAIIMSSFPWLLRGVCIGLIVYSLWRQGKRTAPAALILHGDGRLHQVGAGGTVTDVELLPETTVIGPLVVLCFRASGQSRSVVLLPDSMAVADDFRRLKRWLRWQSGGRSV